MTAVTFDPVNGSTNLTYSNGNLTISNPSLFNSYVLSMATQYQSSGKFYCEFTLGVVGTSPGAGIVNSSVNVSDYVGGDVNGYGYLSTGSIVHNGLLQTVASFTTGDVISVLFDATAGSLVFWKNGAAQGSAITGITGSWTPAASLKYSTGDWTANFGATAFAYTPPAGYEGWDTPAPTPGDAAVTSEPMTAYGARVAAGAVTSEPMTAVGGMNGFGVCVMNPMTNSASGGHNGGAITSVAMTVTATGHAEHSGAVTTQAMTADATGYDSSINTVAVEVPAPTLSCTAITGEVITFAGTVPAPTLECHTKDVRVTVPAPTLSATLLSGSIITVTGRVAAPILVATLDNPVIITASMVVRAPRLVATLAGPAPDYARTLTFAASVPAPRLSAVLLAGNTASAILTLRAPSITAQILTGNVATVLATVAAPTMSAAGYPAYTITFAGTVPAPRLNATLSAAVASAYRTWVLNTKKSALTEYGSEWAMNSYAVFNNVVLGCTSSGIVELGTQALDNATAISSTVKSGQDNFGSSVLKRIPRIYIDYTTGGDAQFALITTEGGTRRYALNWNNVTGVQQRRIPIGKGPKSVRWQWEYTNVGGADFDLGAVLAYPKALHRRTQ